MGQSFPGTAEAANADPSKQAKTTVKNMDSSECSSGCESGWTAYLNCLTDSSHSLSVENDEDLSMVSDASSRPPEDMRKKMKMKKSNTKKLGKTRSDLSLDDTATSPYSKNKAVDERVENLSKEGESASKKQFFKSSTKSSSTASSMGKKKKH